MPVADGNCNANTLGATIVGNWGEPSGESPLKPINFERDRPEIRKAIREYYDNAGENYDHPNSSHGGTMGKIKTLSKLGSASDQIEVKAEYTLRIHVE